MKVPEWVKPAAWGVIGGAIAAIIIGFAWGGWVTGGTAGEMAATSAESAVVQALTPLCVVKAEQQPEKLVPLKEESSYQRDDFVIEAGWVDERKISLRGRRIVRDDSGGRHGSRADCEATWLILQGKAAALTASAGEMGSLAALRAPRTNRCISPRNA